ncbi:MAG TPA: urea ABC transporter ATP-binding subunit UrtE [Candidatus Acidoferrales bacterium]|nr:urea ABC transporter ATP-binding subunit UrtE [Candidatus Acidoferrales bacterium]
MLILERVGAAYGESQVLSGVDMTVGAGEAVTLLGRNGVGKTTLLRSIIGLHRNNQGRVCFDDGDVTSMRAYRRARIGIGYVPQGRGIFPHLTVEENLAMGASALAGRPKHAEGVLDRVLGLFPTLSRVRSRKGGVLSGGEQQQLAIGRALIGEPRLLLLDEPTEGIQPSIVQEIEAALVSIRKDFGVAVLLVEQHLDFAWSIAERYYVMQRGAIVRTGSTRAEKPDDVAALLSV